jgi:maltose/moltooligosaccharide transporter
MGSIFSWFALFSMWIYTVPAVTQHIYGTTDTTSEAYNSANQVGEMFANYNLIAAIASFFIATIGKIYESKIHTLSHLFAEDLVLCLSIS